MINGSGFAFRYGRRGGGLRIEAAVIVTPVVTRRRPIDIEIEHDLPKWESQ